MPRPSTATRYPTFLDALVAWDGYGGYDRGPTWAFAVKHVIEQVAGPGEVFTVPPGGQYVAVYFANLPYAGMLAARGFIDVTIPMLRAYPELEQTLIEHGFTYERTANHGITIRLNRPGCRRSAARESSRAGGEPLVYRSGDEARAVQAAGRGVRPAGGSGGRRRHVVQLVGAGHGAEGDRGGR